MIETGRGHGMLMKTDTDDSVVHNLMPNTTAISLQPGGDGPPPYALQSG